MDAFFGFLKICVICLTGLTALFFVLLALPKSPVRDLVLKLTGRIGITAAGAALVPPADAIPVVGEMYDVAALCAIVYAWYTFFRDIKQSHERKSQEIGLRTQKSRR